MLAHGTARHLQPADDAVADEVAIVQLVLRDDVLVEPVEVLFGQQLSGEEARPAKAFEPAASGQGWQLGPAGKQPGLLRRGVETIGVFAQATPRL